MFIFLFHILFHVLLVAVLLVNRQIVQLIIHFDGLSDFFQHSFSIDLRLHQIRLVIINFQSDLPVPDARLLIYFRTERAIN